MQINSHKVLGVATLLVVASCSVWVGYLIRGHSLAGMAKEDIRLPPVVGTSTNGELVAEINITAHATRTYGQLEFITNNTHKAVLVTVTGEKSNGTCQALLCLTEEGKDKFITVIGLNPYKFIDFLMDGVMFPVPEEIFNSLEKPKKLFSDSEDHRIRDAIFPMIFRRGDQRLKDEWKKGRYYYQPIERVTWIKFKCVNDAKRLQRRGYIPSEISYFIGEDGVVIAHTATMGVYAD